MDDSDATYAPQSPDLSAYNSEYAPEYPTNPYYGQQPQNYAQPNQYQNQTSFLHQNNYDPNPFGVHPSQPVNHYQQPNMARGNRGKYTAEDPDWAPENPPKAGSRDGKQLKVEAECDRPAPGVEEGIEVKTKFPVARIKRIMQADEDVGKVAQVTPTAVSKALELFMISVVTKAANEAKAVSAKRVTASHLKQAVAKDDQFDFLQDIIQKVPDAPPPKKDDDSEEAGESKRKRAGGTRKRKKDDS